MTRSVKELMYYSAYLDLKDRCDTFQQRFFRERMRTDDMADRIAELTEQNKQFTAQKKQSTQALETLKQAFGKEKVESTLEATRYVQPTRYQREHTCKHL